MHGCVHACVAVFFDVCCVAGFPLTVWLCGCIPSDRPLPLPLPCAARQVQPDPQAAFPVPVFPLTAPFPSLFPAQRIKSNQIHKLLREEKDVLVEQVGTLQTQVAAQNQVVRKLEEKENILQNNLSTVEKELGSVLITYHTQQQLSAPRQRPVSAPSAPRQRPRAVLLQLSAAGG